jgi:hypothetical protein
VHTESSELKGKTVKLPADKASLKDLAGQEYRVEDWWDIVTGGSWMFAEGNPAALGYAMRSGMASDIPMNDEVLYGKVGPFGHLIHISELGDEPVIV